MKEIIRIKNGTQEIKTEDFVAALFRHTLAAVIGFISTKAVVLGGIMPFGLSFVAGCPQIFVPSVAIGVFAGYFIPAVGNGGFRYIAAILALVAIRLLVASYKKIAENPIFLGGICLAAEWLTSAVTLTGIESNVFKWIAEGLLAAGGAYFVCRTGRALSRQITGLSVDEMASLLIVVSMFISALFGAAVYGVSLGRVLGIFLILTAAKYGGTLSGSVSGIAFAFSAAMSGMAEQGYTAYAFSGMMAGVFASLGKYAQIAAVSASLLLGCALSGFSAEFPSMLTELIIASAMFALIPRSAGIKLGKMLSCYPKAIAPTGIKKALTMRLNMASGALGDVSQTVENVSKELRKLNSPEFGSVVSGTEQDACGGCKLRIHCWESRKDNTITAILEMTKAAKQGEYTLSDFAPEEFKGRCLRLKKMGEAVYRRYSEYASQIAAENRIDEVRTVVFEQFSGISNMLSDMAADFEEDEQFDNTAALRAAAALKNLDIRIEECSSRIDKFGRMTIEFKMRQDKDVVLNKLQIMKAVSIVCERDFDIPNVSEVGGDIFITLCEHAAFRVDIGVGQICASRTSMCGDAYQYFNDGKGKFIMVLSDGMGTGGRAAVDGAMASGLMSRLLKAGFGYDCSLKILNSSMLFKSSDESLATVDIASIDLFTGETDLFKAGAAPTIVRRSGRTGKAVSTSLPIGILSDVGFDKAGIKMNDGDILLLMSDGAVSEGTDWIRAELEAWRDGSADDLAEHIGECARRRRSDAHEDDITVMAAILEKAV